MAVAAEAPSSMTRGGELQKIEALLGGARVLSRRLTTALDAHELLLIGLPASAIDHLVGSLVFIGKTESLEKAVGMSLRTWQRRKDAPSKPFYASPWFWGAIGAAALGGTAFYFATRDNTPSQIHLQLQVPK